jgi:hypothetical protein
MYCKKCGAQNPDNASLCAGCGETLQQFAPAVRPYIPNYLVQSILVTLFCCLPFGIVAIVFAAQVNGKIQAGDIQGAMSTSKTAKMWCWISFGVGLAVIIVYFAFVILGVMIGAAGHH